MSKKYSLNQEDFKKWGVNIFRFVLIPTVIAFFTALQGGVDIQVAYGVAVGTGYTAVLDLVRKFIAGR